MNRLATFLLRVILGIQIKSGIQEVIYDEDIDGVKSFVENLYKKGLKFDAVVTSDDFLAVGSMNFARANHIKVPSELQVIGYNNSILSHCSEPELSSIDNRLEDMCNQISDAIHTLE